MDGLIEFDLAATEDQPQVYEFSVFLEMPLALDFCVVSTNEVDRRQGGAFRFALDSRNGYIFTHSSEDSCSLIRMRRRCSMARATVCSARCCWIGSGMGRTGLVSDAEKARRQGVQPPTDAAH